MAESPLRPELREQMGDWVMDYVRRRKKMRRRLAVASISIAAGLAVVGTSAWVVLAPQSVVQTHVTCFDGPALSSHSAEAVLSNKPTQDPASYAVQLCGALWQTGQLNSTGDAHGADGKTHPVPPLQLCTRTDGTYTVFPRDRDDLRDSTAFCDALGLVPVPGR